MRFSSLLVCAGTAVATSACDQSRKVADAASEVALTPEQRAVVEDTVRKVAASAVATANRRDVDAFMRFYPDSGVATVGGGLVLMDRDSLHGVITEAWGVPWMKSMVSDVKIERLDVLGPAAAAVTTTSTTTIDSAGKKLTFRNAWTGVWANRDDRWVVVQEHSSQLP